MEDEVSEHPGFHYEWVPDSDWSLGGNGMKCRMLGCRKAAVATLMRSHQLSSGVRKVPYRYCADHLYGRRINNGIVEIRVLARDTDRVSDEQLGKLCDSMSPEIASIAQELRWFRAGRITSVPPAAIDTYEVSAVEAARKSK